METVFLTQEKLTKDILVRSIVTRLVQESNDYQDYTKAIASVEEWLKELAKSKPAEIEMIRTAADEAGEQFLRKVSEVKKVFRLLY